MKAGILKYEIEIYEQQVTRTEFNSSRKEWVKTYTTRADVIFNSGSRIVENDEIFHPTTRTFIVRDYVPVIKTNRIKFEGEYYTILSVNTNKFYRDKQIIAELVNE